MKKEERVQISGINLFRTHHWIDQDHNRVEYAIDSEGIESIASTTRLRGKGLVAVALCTALVIDTIFLLVT